MKNLKKLQEAKEMYKIVGIEVQQAAEAGHYNSLKQAQKRSLSLANKIMKLETKIAQEEKLMEQEIKMEQAEQKEFPEITTRNTPKPVATVQVTCQFNNKEIEAIRTEILDIRLEIEPKAKTTIIYCEDCGTAREIKVQDKFQVKRCPECQKNYKNAIRRAKRQQKSAKLSKTEEEAK